MKVRSVITSIAICFFLVLIIYFLGGTVLDALDSYNKSEVKKVKDWQKQNLLNNDIPKLIPTTSSTIQPYIDDGSEESSEDAFDVDASTQKPLDNGSVKFQDPLETTTTTSSTSMSSSIPTTTSPSTTTTTTASTTTTTSTTTSPTTTTSTTTTTEPPTTTNITTTEAPTPPTTTTRIRTYTFPTRRPTPSDPYRHRYGPDRVIHYQTHPHHRHHETAPTTTTTTTTTTMTTTTSEVPTTTTRIRVTSSYLPPSSSSNSIPDRITVLPTSSSYHNRYMQKISVSTSSSPSSTHRPHHHHHQHHNQTHINVHRHNHHIYPNLPYPGFPNIRYPATSEAPTTTTTVTTTTTSSRHHHHHEHHHGKHHHHHTSTTKRPSTTTTRETELDRWGFVESVEDVSQDEESSTTTTTTSTTSTTTPSTTTSPSTEAPRAPQRPPPRVPGRGRFRQPEPIQPPPPVVQRETTLVTAFMDIGRGEWNVYRRPLEIYHQFMETLLNLDNYFVIFTDESTFDFVEKTRKKLGLLEKTKIYKITLDEIPLWSYINEGRKIISDELANDTFWRSADMDMKTHPESISAEYNIVVNSKTHFLHNVTLENPFNAEHFVWLDAGYGHANENYFPYSYKWVPALPDGKISLIKILPTANIEDYDLKSLYRKNVAVLSGGFIAGDKHSIGQLHSIIHRKFIQLIYQGYIDDDQTLLTLAVNSHRHLFNIVEAGWFDAFRKFAADPEVQLG